MELTLLEVHLDDASFTANAPFSSDETASDAESSAEATPEGDDGRAATDLIPFVLGLAVLAGIAFAVRRLRGGDEETGTEIEPEIAEPETATA